jgi:hypothetical protein
MEELCISINLEICNTPDGKQQKNISYHKIINITSRLQEYIENETVLLFILTLQTRDLQMELFFIWWNTIKNHLHDTLIHIPSISFEILKNLYSFSHTSCNHDIPIPGQIYNAISFLSTSEHIPLFIRNEASDLIHGVRRQQINITDNTKRIENERRILNNKADKKSIYNNKQNVHTSDINSSAINAARKLIKITNSIINIDNKYQTRIFINTEFKDILNQIATLEQCNTDQITISCKQPYTGSKIIPENSFSTDTKLITTLEDFLQYQNMLKIIIKRQTPSILFIHRDKAFYSQVYKCTDIVFPKLRDEDTREIKKKKTRSLRKLETLQKIFIATNQLLLKASIQELNFYLDASGIINAREIWTGRIKIINSINKILEIEDDAEAETSLERFSKTGFFNITPRNKIDEFVDEVFEILFSENKSRVNTRNFLEFKKFLKISKVRDIYLHDVLNAVWKFIHSHVDKDVLLLRLKEELIDASDVCSTGILSRLVNSIQSFTLDTELQISMSDIEELQAKIIHNINTELQNKQCDVIVDPEKAIEIITQWRNNNVENLCQEYSKNNKITSQTITKLINNIFNCRLADS